MLVPENPRAAQMAASGLAAMAMLALTWISAARRASAAATSCGSPKRRSRPDASNVDGMGSGLLHRGGEFEGQGGQRAVAVKTGEHVLLRWVEVARAEMARSKSRRMERAGPGGVLAGAFQLQGGAGFGVRLARHGDQHGGAVFDGAAQAKPGRKRNAAGGGGRGIAEIEDDEAETAALDQQIGGFEGVLGVVGGTDPEEAVEADAGCAGGSGVEGIFGIDEGADFCRDGWLGRGWRAAGWCGRRKRGRRSR